MGEFSLTHILLFAIVVIIFFGPRKLPELGKSMGEAIRGFKKAMNSTEDRDQHNAQISQKENSDSLTKERDTTKSNRS